MTTVKSIVDAPVYRTDRAPLQQRVLYDFRDYGFWMSGALGEQFDIVPVRLDDEAFFFFFPREDIAAGRWSLFNLHVFFKKTGSLEDFAHGLGESVRTIALSSVSAFGRPALGYSREIAMRDLFKGGEPVIDFIGGTPDRIVTDSHYYFMHRRAHCYTGMLHSPGEDKRYARLRSALFAGIHFVCR